MAYKIGLSVFAIAALGALNWSINAAETYRKLSESEIKTKPRAWKSAIRISRNKTCATAP